MSLENDEMIAKKSYKNILAISVKTIDALLTAIGIIGILYSLNKIYGGLLYIESLGLLGTKILITVYIILAALKIIDVVLIYPIWLKLVTTLGTIGITIYIIGVIAIKWSGGFVGTWVSGDFTLTLSVTLLAVGEILDYADGGVASKSKRSKKKDTLEKSEQYRPPIVIDAKDENECYTKKGTWSSDDGVCYI